MSKNLIEPAVYDAFFGGFPDLRPIQKATIKPLTEGKHVVACSGTGSGKTEAALAPLVSRYWKDFEKVDSTLILYIAPTKALVNDLARRLEYPMDKMELRYGVRHGDKDDIKRRKKLPHIVITTPESLDVMLFREDVSLKTVRAVVIDEVHLLYNTQRGLQLSVLLERLRKFVKAGKLQLAALSATIANLMDVGRFFFGEEDVVKLEFPADRSIDAQIRLGDYANVVGKIAKGGKCKILAFANSRKLCEELADSITETPGLHDAVFTHYSSLSKEKREEIETKFQELKAAVCNATSTLELGIDIGDIDVVLLCAVPAGTESFLQRIGRGNRRSNKTNAVCFVGIDQPDISQNTEALRYAVLIETAKKGELSARGTYELFGAVAQQCMSIIASQKGYTSLTTLTNIFKNIPHVDRATIERILVKLAEDGYLVRHEVKKQFGPAEKLHRLVKQRRIYGNFPVGLRMVEVRHDKEVLLEVPLFNVDKFGPGSVVSFLARKWKITDADLEKILVEPAAADAPASVFEFGGRGIGFETFLTDRMWRMIHSDNFPRELLIGDVKKNLTKAKDTARKLCRPDTIPYCRTEGGFRYFTFGGSLVNEAVALFTNQEDFKAEDLALEVSRPIEWKSLPIDPQEYRPVFDRLFKPTMEQTIFQRMLPWELQVQEYVQEWLKDEAIPAVLARLVNSVPVEVSPDKWPF
jgi:ATP-dependent helicase Lhr and Lhr-like helicase